MALTIEQAEEYLEKAKDVEKQLSQKTELFSSDQMDEFKNIIVNLQKNIGQLKERNRDLRIGVIGAVKAGKSSFLNAFFFNGENFLPKAATPMTATLTILSYSDEPSATVYFYTKEDWKTIQERAKEYDDNLEKAYEEYQNLYNEQVNTEIIRNRINRNKIEPMASKSDFEKRYRSQSNISEYQLAAKELISMSESVPIEDKLGTKIKLEGDVIKQLEDYIGSKGEYASIVSYVELQLNDESLKGLEIIDTPGLNDPIVSRGMETKRHLGECDVVLLLSPCSQFMDEETIQLMSNSLPSAGIEELVVIGSKLDSGILNDKGGKFRQKWAKSLRLYRRQLDKNLAQIKENGRNAAFISKIDSSDALFVSSMCFDIYIKRKEGRSLNEEEAHIFNELNTGFEDFDPSDMFSISGMSAVGKRLDEIAERKKEIIDSRSENLLTTISSELLTILETINAETISSRKRLENSSVEELKHQSEEISKVIGNTRLQLLSMFKNSSLDCEKKGEDIKTLITLKKEEIEDIKVSTTTRTEPYTIEYGPFGLFHKTGKKTITEYSADTAKTKHVIELYAARCLDTINREFQSLFNEQEFSRQIKDIILRAFETADVDFEKDEILLPLETLLKELEIPRIEFDAGKYIDRVSSMFSSGYAENTDIHKLSSLREDCLSQISRELSGNLEIRIQQIKETLNNNAATFADKIEKKLCGELDRIQGQMAEKEEYITKYEQFSVEINAMKNSLTV